jgi:hypothetical protein
LSCFSDVFWLCDRCQIFQMNTFKDQDIVRLTLDSQGTAQVESAMGSQFQLS